MITTRCPRTWREIPIGIDTDADTFKRLPDVPGKLICPECGEEHIWRKADAWLALDQPSLGATH
jgi:hypothetical protein